MQFKENACRTDEKVARNCLLDYVLQSVALIISTNELRRNGSLDTICSRFLDSKV
jgi:hypothetical protein